MTALKPIENRSVIGVPAEEYPSNLICAHPECNELVDLRPDGTPTVHHIFPRSQTKSKSYFVMIDGIDLESDEMHKVFKGIPILSYSGGKEGSAVIPHAVGICGTGTTGHHGDLEEHRAWIKLENGVYVWYDRIDREPEGPLEFDFVEVGPLNPQPGSREGKPKRKKQATTKVEKEARVNTTIRTTVGEKNVLPELIEQCRERVKDKLEYDKSPSDYLVLTTVLYDWLIDG